MYCLCLLCALEHLEYLTHKGGRRLDKKRTQRLESPEA